VGAESHLRQAKRGGLAGGHTGVPRRLSTSRYCVRVIEAVVFDLGDTLVRFDNREPHIAWERRLGLAPGTLWEAVAAAADWRDAFLGGDEEEPWDLTAKALGLALTDIPALRADFFACERLEDDLLEFALELRPRYRTGILSDAPASTRTGTIKKFGLDDCFDAVVLSGEIKAAKPDPRAFTAVLNALAVPPERAIFVDNSPDNIEGATALGMQTVLAVGRSRSPATLSSPVITCTWSSRTTAPTSTTGCSATSCAPTLKPERHTRPSNATTSKWPRATSTCTWPGRPGLSQACSNGPGRNGDCRL
jgi:FMN phosphatase YigB (HAD superfamily)